MTNYQHRKWEDLLAFSAVLLLMILLNIHAGSFRFRLDLTAEQRYTISDATINLLEDLNDVVYVEVFLEGDLNADFKRLQKSVRETLEEFQVYAGTNVQFRFTDPADQADDPSRQVFYQQLISKGIPATNLFDNKDGERTEKIIFPGALVTYRNKETGVLLLKGNKSASPQEQLNQSAEGVEYELATAIRKLASNQKKNVAFVQGHGELTAEETAGITAALTEFYIVDRTELENPRLEEYDALIVAGPKEKFSELDKFKLDQYIMKGGKAMFFVDAVQMNIDSIARGGSYAFGYDLGLEEQLFQYGVRVNYDLIQDRQQPGILEVYSGQFGNQPKIQPFPWPYYIYLNRYSEHPIVKNMDLVLSKFVSTIDTIQNNGVRKTPLMFTSQYSRIRKMPSMVDLNEIRQEMDYSFFQQSFLPVAYLLEGEFQSLYAFRFPPRGIQGEPVKQSLPNKMVVVGDADILRTEKDPRTGNPVAIDYDKYRKQGLSNAEFVINALTYLVEENGVISSRKKQMTLRLLDKARLQEETTLWQVINVAVPTLLVVLFGVSRRYWRRKKFES